MDDRTSGLVIRALRKRDGWSQADLAARAGVSQSTISRAERGWLEDLTLRVIRAIFAALEARVQLAPRWKGAELERLLDEAHSALVAAVAGRLEGLGWTVELEVTYSEFGERGSIDVLATRPTERSIVVVEVKTDIASSEAVGRKVDEKVRLAPRIVATRLGWRPVNVGRLLVMPDQMRLRRLVERHEVIGRMFPMGAIAVRRWLREPGGAMAGLWFLSDIARKTGRDQRAPVARRIRPRSGRIVHGERRSATGSDPIRARIAHTQSGRE
jgi:transcriptional regulator with XRE-family HTH domain